MRQITGFLGRAEEEHVIYRLWNGSRRCPKVVIISIV